ncbi:MFS transporter superfamily protein [Pleurotus pulmonarius]
MASEETPLLGLALLDHSRIYDRFSPWEKRGILALVSFSGLIPFLVSGTFIPAIPQIAHDLSTTPETVGLTISLSIFGAAIGSMAMATYSGFYGRRPLYLAGLPLFCLGSYQIAVAHNIYHLVAWRFVQNVGVSGGMSLGAGVIGDIYKLEERGFAMGIFYGITLLGPALAPVTGGLATHYASWRALQWVFLVYGLMLFASIALWLPETSHPGTLGAEKQQREAQDMPGAPPRQIDRLGWVWLNPLSCMALLRSPNLLLVMLAGAATLLTDFVLLVPLAYTIGAKYGITNEALIGAVFIPCGMGNIVGAPLAGFLSDRFILARAKHGRQQANGGGGEEEIGAGAGVGWYPEDRLRATLVGAAVCVPLSVLLVGLTTTYVPGRTGLAMCLAWLFMNGLGVDMVLCPSAAYNVDVVHTRSAEIMAANNGARALLISLLVPFILPSITRFGILATNAAAAAIAWGGLGLLLLTIHYGEQLRGWKDIGYSTASNN